MSNFSVVRSHKHYCARCRQWWVCYKTLHAGISIGCKEDRKGLCDPCYDKIIAEDKRSVFGVKMRGNHIVRTLAP